MTDNRRDCSPLGATAELGLSVIYITLHHSGEAAGAVLRKYIGPRAAPNPQFRTAKKSAAPPKIVALN